MKRQAKKVINRSYICLQYLSMNYQHAKIPSSPSFWDMQRIFSKKKKIFFWYGWYGQFNEIDVSTFFSHIIKKDTNFRWMDLLRKNLQFQQTIKHDIFCINKPYSFYNFQPTRSSVLSDQDYVLILYIYTKKKLLKDIYNIITYVQ